MLFRSSNSTDPWSACRIWLFLERQTLDDPVRSCSVESAMLHLDGDGDHDDAAVCVIGDTFAAPKFPIQLGNRFKELQVSDLPNRIGRENEVNWTIRKIDDLPFF